MGEAIDFSVSEAEVNPGFNLENFLQRNKFSALLAVLGILILGIGVLGMVAVSTRETRIEILSEENQLGILPAGTIFVDLTGAVQKPGVYELKSGSRINDLLILAGGLSAEASREWVSQNMNLAQKLTDGAKVYIPVKPETRNSQLANRQTANAKININTASASQLDTLWGIGPATAQKVISGRPYQAIEELLTRKIVKSNVWEAIRDKITVY
jgi:competence protein ComEA